MRISTGMIFDAGVRSINRQTTALLHLQQQVAANTRILAPSDDPVAAARALEVTQSKAVNAQFKLNHNNASSALGLEETQLTSAGDIIARVRELTVQAGNTGLASSDRVAITTELRARFDELMGLANATDGAGQYLFSGFMGSTKPFGGNVDALVSGATADVNYSGDDGQRRLQVSPTRFLEVSDSGNDVFNRIRNGNGYFTTDYAVDAATLKGSNSGTAVIDAGNVTDPAKWNASTNKDFQIKFYVDSATTPPTTYYDIVDTAAVPNSMVTGLPAVSPPATFPGGLRQFYSDQPIMLANLSTDGGIGFDVGASVIVAGVPANGDSFDIAPSSSQSIFKTIANLIGAMESANTGTSAATANLSNDIGFALTNLDQATDNILRVRAQIGSRMNEIDSLSSVNQDLDLQYQQTLSNLQDLDYAKTLSDLTLKQTQLQAAQQSFVKIAQLSLFNYL